MDASSTCSCSFDTRSTDCFASSHPGRPWRHSEPNPAAWTRLVLPTTASQLAVPKQNGPANKIGAAWASSGGSLADLTDADEDEVRTELVQEYNQLAMKHGIRTLAPEDHSALLPGQIPQQSRRRWFSRTFLRHVSTASDTSSTKSEKTLKTRRSVGDLALQLVNGTRRDNLKDEDLQSLVRLCGAETRGVFRIPGSVRIVNALYKYYCADGDVEAISSTTCCPTLPSHIKAGTHDVASTFKRLLSGLPGGILGSLAPFDALVAIHGQLDGEAGLDKTQQIKVRARLIALVICTVRTQLRRDLICAVFGLLSLIGCAAEDASRQDEHGKPLPASDLMGYNALGIVFGPLLVGDLLNAYAMEGANPNTGLLLPTAAPAAGKERRGSKVTEEAHPRTPAVDKIHVANSITEMLITHWRVQGPITPQRTSSTRWSTRSAYASKETPSTTHRFPLLSTPEQNQQQTTPILDSSGPTANTDANPATESSRDEEANLSLRPQLQPRKPVEDEHREETSHFDHADVDKSNRNTVDTELARLRRQLRQAEQACAMWRERAERAELRVRALERGGC
ncbi:91e761e2-4dc8-4d24-8244-0dbc3bac0e00 [Thermothielavioides terrestris]|uniref:91e761e2-4dc8-4d24-8244-0dbc3bac0e00 n=1 Tax=Thermothielavioides terrestris TaxID=2587410 RepID=A0A446BGT2_9PEZI|nr:91e761e2-4dc8-4d24-8244-0dbc3bac0e00 [Thermothielavioides terrestris]